MPIRMPVPPGNKQLRMYDGTVLKADRGHVTIDNPDHAKAINAMGGNGDAGLLNAAFAVHGAVTKPGRVCPACGFHGYAFTMTCPRASCGTQTVPE